MVRSRLHSDFIRVVCGVAMNIPTHPRMASKPYIKILVQYGSYNMAIQMPEWLLDNPTTRAFRRVGLPSIICSAYLGTIYQLGCLVQACTLDGWQVIVL
jgi:hypothetical protein